MPASNPNFGTGYVDWGNYVNANMPNIQADRAKVGNYMNKQYGQLMNTAAGGQGFDQQQENLITNQQALNTPGGFEQVLAQANAAYDPRGDKAPPQAANDPFSAALEGQNAGSLFKGHPELVTPNDASPPGTQPYKNKPPPQVPRQTPGPMPTGPEHRPDKPLQGDQPGTDPWSTYINRKYKGNP